MQLERISNHCATNCKLRLVFSCAIPAFNFTLWTEGDLVIEKFLEIDYNRCWIIHLKKVWLIWNPIKLLVFMAQK